MPLGALGAKSCANAKNYNLLGLALSCQFIRCHLFRSGQSIGSAHFHIGLYTCTFPVAFGHRVDGATEWHTNRKVVAAWHPSHRMSTPARGLANNGGAFLCLQVERELFTTRKSLVRSENIHRLIREARPKNPRQRPVLVSLVIVPVGKVVDVGRLAKQIGI